MARKKLGTYAQKKLVPEGAGLARFFPRLRFWLKPDSAKQGNLFESHQVYTPRGLDKG